MGLLQGQYTTIAEGDCYNYLMEQFCEDVYFAIAAKTGTQNMHLSMFSCQDIFMNDMYQYLESIIAKAPKCFISYLVDNEYINVFDLGPIEFFVTKEDLPCTTRMTEHIYSIFFTQKLKNLFYDYDIAGIRNIYNELKTIKL